MRTFAFALTASAVAAVPTQNFAEWAKAAPDHSSLVAALEAGDLAAMLGEAASITVFAPTNDGFAKLPSGMVDNLMKPANKAWLVDILKYHVIPSVLPMADVPGAYAPCLVKTMQGQDVCVFLPTGGQHVEVYSHGDATLGHSGVYQANGEIKSGDNPVTNGLVHTIDFVLLPPDENKVSGGANALDDQLGVAQVYRMKKMASAEVVI